MTLPNIYGQLNDPPLTGRSDLSVRVLDVVAAVMALGLLITGFSLPTYLAVIVLMGTWSSRFVWAVLRTLELHKNREPSRLERVTMRGSHLALVVALYMSALVGALLIAYFLAAVMVLISLERMVFRLKHMQLAPIEA